MPADAVSPGSQRPSPSLLCPSCQPLEELPASRGGSRQPQSLHNAGNPHSQGHQSQRQVQELLQGGEDKRHVMTKCSARF